jgi:hypothetical protein
MSFYQTTPFKASPKLLIQGTPEYVFGSLNVNTSPTLGFVISDSGNGTTSTVVFQITAGNIPIAGSLVTIVGTANAAGAYNATNATVLTVVTTSQGVCSITFAGSGNSASAQDFGAVEIPQIEVGDNFTAGIVAAVPVASVPVAGVVGATTIGRSMSATVTFPVNSTAFPSTLSAATVVIQGSNIDRDDHYNTIGTLVTGTITLGNTYDWQSGQGNTNAAAVGALSAGSVDLMSFRFYRLQVTAATGAGYVVGTIMQ